MILYNTLNIIMYYFYKIYIVIVILFGGVLSSHPGT